MFGEMSVTILLFVRIYLLHIILVKLDLLSVNLPPPLSNNLVHFRPKPPVKVLGVLARDGSKLAFPHLTQITLLYNPRNKQNVSTFNHHRK